MGTMLGLCGLVAFSKVNMVSQKSCVVSEAMAALWSDSRIFSLSDAMVLVGELAFGMDDVGISGKGDNFSSSWIFSLNIALYLGQMRAVAGCPGSPQRWQ